MDAPVTGPARSASRAVVSPTATPTPPTYHRGTGVDNGKDIGVPADHSLQMAQENHQLVVIREAEALARGPSQPVHGTEVPRAQEGAHRGTEGLVVPIDP